MQRYCISSCLSPVIVIHYSDRRRGRGVMSSSLLSRIKDSRIRQSIDPRSSFFVSLWPPRARLVTHSSSHCKSKKIEKESIAFPVRISRRIFGINSFESNREIYLIETYWDERKFSLYRSRTPRFSLRRLFSYRQNCCVNFLASRRKPRDACPLRRFIKAIAVFSSIYLRDPLLSHY